MTAAPAASVREKSFAIMPAPPGHHGASAVGGVRQEAAGHQSWWVKGWRTCRSYQNSASRRDGNGRGFQDAHLAPAQRIMVSPSAVAFSTGLCTGPRRRRARWSLTACMASTLSAQDRKSTRLNSSHVELSYAVFCLKKK